MEVVKQEMARVSIDLVRTSELKWMRMGKLIQKTIMSTTMGKNPLDEIQ